MEGEGAGRVELFEVFKVGSLQRSELEKLSLEDLRKRYILMQNLTSKEQLVTATELAQLPAPEHMVVDKSNFQRLVNDKVSKAVDLQVRKVRAQADERIFHAHEVFDRDRLAIAQLLKTNIELEEAKLGSLVEHALERRKAGEDVDADDLLKKLSSVLEDHKHVFTVLFSNPFFCEAKPEEEEPTEEAEKKEKEKEKEKEEGEKNK